MLLRRIIEFTLLTLDDYTSYTPPNYTTLACSEASRAISSRPVLIKAMSVEASAYLFYKPALLSFVTAG